MRTNNNSSSSSLTSPAALAAGAALGNTTGGSLSTNMTNYTTSLSLRVAGRAASTSPNRTITNGSIRNGNINRNNNTNNSNFNAATTTGGGEVNGNSNSHPSHRITAPSILSMSATSPTAKTKDAATTAAAAMNGLAEKFEVPLPFGYHLDLDFLRVCSDDPSGETLEKLKELRRMRRKQRKTLEALMGFRQQELRTVPEAKVAVSVVSSSSSTGRPVRPVDLQLVATSRQQPDIVNSSELVREALRESMVSFQQTLDQYKSPDQYKSADLSDFDLIHGVTSTPNREGNKERAKFTTFPRLRTLGSPDEPDKLSRHLSNSSISSVSTNSSALPYSTPLSPEAYLASLPSSVPARPEDEMETYSIASINSEMSTNTLRSIREQMARSLVKLKEYEKQVEAIPMLQVKLSVLKEEKRLLMLKLKAREARIRRDRGDLEDAADEASTAAALESAQLFEEAMDTDDEDLDLRVAKMSDSLRRQYTSSTGMGSSNLNRRARSESPYAKCATNTATVHPEEFLSVQRKRSTSCGFNSDNSYNSDLSPPTGPRKYYTQDSPEFALRRSTYSSQRGIVAAQSSSGHQQQQQRQQPEAGARSAPVQTEDKEVNTEPLREPAESKPAAIKAVTRERATNTDTLPSVKSPPPPAVIARKVNHGTNTLKIRSIPKATATDMKMTEIWTREDVEAKIQEAMLRTEEEILSCPLLQKALKKVEEEALHGPVPEKEWHEAACQVGLENLRPFVIDVGLMCKLDPEVPRPEVVDQTDSWCQVTPKTVEKLDVACGLSSVELMNLKRSVGVGECLVIETPKEPSRFRTVGICTEKWVEVIRASKQTDTEDFAFKDTESPRVADIEQQLPAMPPASGERHQRLSSITAACLRKSSSPSVSRRSSTNSPSVSRKSSALSTAGDKAGTVDVKHKETMTGPELMPNKPIERPKEPSRQITAACQTSTAATQTEGSKSSSSGLALPLLLSSPSRGGVPHLPPGSPLSTPDTEHPTMNMSLCEKCEKDIHQVAVGIMSLPGTGGGVETPTTAVAPPSTDMPWLSKIPRPCPPLPTAESPELSRIKSATSTGNLSQLILNQRSYSPSPVAMQRSKSNLEPSSSSVQHSRLALATGSGMGGSCRTPPPMRRDLGTPPPHPNTPPVGSKRAPSPLTRSSTPNLAGGSGTGGGGGSSGEKKSLIPKISGSSLQQQQQQQLSQQQRKTPTMSAAGGASSGLAKQKDSPAASSSPLPGAAADVSKSLIPRVVTPPALRKMFPRTDSSGKSGGQAGAGAGSGSSATGGSHPDKNLVRRNTYNKSLAGVNNPDLDRIEEHPARSGRPSGIISEQEEQMGGGGGTDSGEETETLEDMPAASGGDRVVSGSGFPLPGAALFTPIVAEHQPRRSTKAEPSKEMKAALKVLQDSLGRGAAGGAVVRSSTPAQVTSAVNIIQQEWFKTSSTKQSNPADVEDYLDFIEEMSRDLLDQVVNLVDVNGNTALHYSVSHGSFDVVSILLDSKVANTNILNKAGYTCSMLISLAVIRSETHRAVVKRLFALADVNMRASQHGQTALMLAVSHGRLDMVQLLLEAGADVNIRDEDGSTALMCAAEHGHVEIVKLLMHHPDINLAATDNDGLTALSVAMEAGHRDIGVLLYANMSFSRGASPHSSMRMKRSSSRNSVVGGGGGAAGGAPASPIPPTPPHRSRRNSSN